MEKWQSVLGNSVGVGGLLGRMVMDEVAAWRRGGLAVMYNRGAVRGDGVSNLRSVLKWEPEAAQRCVCVVGGRRLMQVRVSVARADRACLITLRNDDQMLGSK